MYKIKSKIIRTYYQLKAGSSAPVFIHIPKTGGTFLGQFETFKTPVLWPVKHLGHVAICDSTKSGLSNYPPYGYSKRKIVSKDSLKNRFVFSTCRNIFDWLVSYAGHAGGWTPKYDNPDHYDYDNVKKGFDYLLKSIVNREEPWPSRKMIHFPMFSEDSELMVDWVCRTETLNEDLEDLADFLNCKYTSKEKQRVGRRDDYRTYYSDELIDLVYKTWGSELALFGYDFEGPRKDIAFLPRKVEEKHKKSIHYDWDKDILVIDNKCIEKDVKIISL